MRAEALRSGDIVLTATLGKASKVVRRASKGDVSHAMICVQNGSTIDSTEDRVQAINIQRELYETGDTVYVLRMCEAPDEVGMHRVVEFARSEIGTRYSKIEAARTVMGGSKPRSRQMFCSRLGSVRICGGGYPRLGRLLPAELQLDGVRKERFLVLDA